jgi:hypothetical protein
MSDYERKINPVKASSTDQNYTDAYYSTDGDEFLCSREEFERVYKILGISATSKDVQTCLDGIRGGVLLEEKTCAKRGAGQTGTKYDDGKASIALIPVLAVEEEARVWSFGAKKYGQWNWSKGLSVVRIMSGVLRHIYAYLRGEDLDPESGLSHLAHARCGLGMLEHFRQSKREELDDRMHRG